MKILNVGGNRVQMPPQYSECNVTLLDIDPGVSPDLCMDARDLGTLEPGQFDGVYCSHNLEHYHEHEVALVLRGFYYVLTDEGFVDARVPDVATVMRRCVEEGLDLDATLYIAPVGPIRVCDVLWGWQKEIERSGQPYFAHRWGFTERTLGLALAKAGFRHIYVDSGRLEVKALGFKGHPSDELLERLGVSV